VGVAGITMGATVPASDGCRSIGPGTSGLPKAVSSSGWAGGLCCASWLHQYWWRMYSHTRFAPACLRVGAGAQQRCGTRSKAETAGQGSITPFLAVDHFLYLEVHQSDNHQRQPWVLECMEKE
jgi:hypothetical protein